MNTFKELNQKETKDLLISAGAFASESILDMSLSLYPQYYRINKAYQYTFEDSGKSLLQQLAGCSLPSPLPEWKATVVCEITCGPSISQLDEIRSWVDSSLGTGIMLRFEPACYYAGEFPARITIVYHAAKPRRSYYSSIHNEYSFLRETERRIARKLDEELRRNEEMGTVFAMEEPVVADIMYKHHFLWTGIANSNSSVEEVVSKLRPEMAQVMDKYDVSGLMLFVEVDKDRTTEGEVSDLVNKLRIIAGGQGTDVALNIRTRDSYVKSITCRAALVGNPKCVMGEVREDLGLLEILLFVSDDEKRGYEILASYEDGELTLSRYDWGAYEYNRMGQTDDHHYFDKENTIKLFSALHVKKPYAFLRTIYRRFASRFPSMADEGLLAFCRKHAIEFSSDYHY